MPNNLANQRSKFFAPVQPDLIERFSAARQYQLQVENFSRRVAGGAQYPWSLEDARGTQVMIDMVFNADKSAPSKGQ